MRLMVCVGLLALGCAGGYEGGSDAEPGRPTDVVVSRARDFQAEESASAEMEQPEETAAAADEGPGLAVSQPEAAPGEPKVSETAPAAPVPNTDATPPAPPAPPAPGCELVDGGWVCEAACVASWPVPSAVVDGHLGGYTADGRQLCGGRISDGCGHTAELATACPGLDACGGEGANEDGAPDEERFICAECRLDTDPVVAAARVDATHPVVLAGCAPQPDCVTLEVQGSDGRFRAYQFCATAPRALR